MSAKKAPLRITVAAVGRLRRSPEHDLVETYRQRLLWPVTIREVEERGALPAAERQRREASRLLDAVPDGAVLIALDERGKTPTSTAFAERLRHWLETGRRDLAFLIGGADGLDRSVTEKADLTLGLGPMTWPHMLVRVMLLEQLYRAQQILAGHPYHRE